MVQHVVWDWNGTLADDFDLIVRAASASCAPHRQAPLTAAEYRRHFTRPVQAFYEAILERPVTPAEWDVVQTTFRDSYAASLDEVALADGAPEALQAVSAAGVTQSLLSMWLHELLVPTVARFGIAGHFTVVEGLEADEGGGKGPHLARHLRHLPPMAPDDVVVIGDSLDDAAAAAAVGARCILVEGGSHDRSDLDGLGVPVAASLLEALELAGLR